MKKILFPALLAGLACQGYVRADNRPNIIYIMTDQQSALALGAAGNTDLRTPNMDRLARKGVRFSNAYCAFPLSGPSRSAMFTGYTPGQAGLRVNGTPLPDSLRTSTLGDLVKAAGYETGYAGKWHVHTNSLPAKESFGFERLHGHGDEGLAEAAVGFLRQKHDKPFFLVASFDNPHNICQYARWENLPEATVEEPFSRSARGCRRISLSRLTTLTLSRSKSSRATAFTRPRTSLPTTGAATVTRTTGLWSMSMAKSARLSTKSTARTCGRTPS